MKNPQKDIDKNSQIRLKFYFILFYSSWLVNNLHFQFDWMRMVVDFRSIFYYFTITGVNCF